MTGADGGPPAAPEPEWAGWPDERLLDLRLCDLGLTIRAGELSDRIAQLYDELKNLGLRFRPHFWLSDEWYCPDGVPGVAIPFYLAHPRLARLELTHMLEVEGGTPEWCMRILRHETGHAIENAYRLRRRRRRQKLFGKSSERYRDYYVPRPYSRRFVVHLEQWYAQSHPDEDFAETFAVWLAPESNWRERYAGWPALQEARVRRRDDAGDRRPAPGGRLAGPRRSALAPAKDAARALRGEAPALRPRRGRLLRPRPPAAVLGGAGVPGAPAGGALPGRIRREVRRRVAQGTGVYQYTIDQVLGDMIDRCRELGLRVAVPEEQAKLDFTSRSPCRP